MTQFLVFRHVHVTRVAYAWGMTKLPLQLLPGQRRAVLQRILAVSAAAMLPANTLLAQPSATSSLISGRPWFIAQIVDVSTQQQDVAKDFLIGSRAAWQDINAKGGLFGRTIKHLVIETDGTASSLRTAVDSVRDNQMCLALSGTVGDRTAVALTKMLQEERSGLAHVAPWLQNTSSELGDHTFPIFADRQDQIAYIVKSLSLMGVKEVGVVYASKHEQIMHQQEVDHIARRLLMKLVTVVFTIDLKSLGQKLSAESPAVLLFIGGTPELALFTGGLAKQDRQRYILALADVNLQTMMQMGAARLTPIIAAQTVPMVNSAMPIVRSYRGTLVRLYDEPPTPLSLAGFIAANYTFDVLKKIKGPMNRQTVLAAFQRRDQTDVGGYRVSYNATGRGSQFVTQSMLSKEGHTVG
jgi:ABC-type branched-subunit amino acid transport system substrate-binding protein